MNEQELRKLNRRDLLELLIAQAREKEQLTEELERVKEELHSRQIKVEEIGSIAEASLQLNGVFAAAEAAAAQYLENIRLRTEQTDELCARKEAETEKRCQDMEKASKERAEAYWKEVSDRLEEFYKEHGALKELLRLGGSYGA